VGAEFQGRPRCAQGKIVVAAADGEGASFRQEGLVLAAWFAAAKTAAAVEVVEGSPPGEADHASRDPWKRGEGDRGRPPPQKEKVRPEDAEAMASTVAGGSSSSVKTIVAPVRPRFEPGEAGSSVPGPQARWAGFSRALMGLQRGPRRPFCPGQKSHAIT
jgi:hypothetical protein